MTTLHTQKAFTPVVTPSDAALPRSLKAPLKSTTEASPVVTFGNPQKMSDEVASPKSTTGFTLIETLIYGTILAVVCVLVVGALLRIGPVYVKAQNLRKVNAAGSFAIDRLVREMRKGTNFDFSNGELTFDSEATFDELVRRDGAVSYYNFEETSGPLIDQIGTNNSTAFSASSPTREVGAMVGNGYAFSNSSENPNSNFIDLPDGVFNFNQGAIEMVVRMDASAQTVPFFAHYSENTTNSRIIIYGFGANGGGSFLNFGSLLYDTAHTGDESSWMGTLWQYINNGAGFLSSSSDYLSLLGTQYIHFVVALGSDGRSRVYVDGKLDRTSDTTGKYLAYISNNGVPTRNRFGGVGTSMTTGVGPFAGVIDEFAIYSNVQDPSAAEAKWRAHYKAAFGLQDDSGDTTITRSVSLTNGVINYSPNGTPTPLTSDVSVSNLSVNLVRLQPSDPGVGAEISFTVTAGTGSTAVSRTFKTAAVGRKTN